MERNNKMEFDDKAWERGIEKLYKQYENIPDDIKAELQYYKKRVTILQFNLRQAKQDIEVASRNAYQEGWNDAVKKIDNFIERHCKDWFEVTK